VVVKRKDETINILDETYIERGKGGEGRGNVLHEEREDVVQLQRQKEKQDLGVVPKKAWRPSALGKRALFPREKKKMVQELSTRKL